MLACAPDKHPTTLSICSGKQIVHGSNTEVLYMDIDAEGMSVWMEIVLESYIYLSRNSPFPKLRGELPALIC